MRVDGNNSAAFRQSGVCRQPPSCVVFSVAVVAVCLVLGASSSVCVAQGPRQATSGRALSDETAIQARDWVVFASRDCGDCRWFREQFAAGLTDRLPGELPGIHFVDLDRTRGYELLIGVEERMPDAGNGGDAVPVLLAGEQLYYGREAISGGRDRLIQAALARAEMPAPVLDVLRQHRSALSPLSAVGTTREAGDESQETSVSRGFLEHQQYATAEVLYFYTPGCDACSRVEKQLRYFKSRHPDVAIARIDTSTSFGRRLQEAVANGLGVDRPRRLATPMLADGRGALAGDGLTDKQVAELFRGTPGDPFWANWNEEARLAAATRRIKHLSETFTLSAVIVAGVIDGVNPCAFAVIVFLVSYLTLARKTSRGTALSYGLLFTAGVFVCYLLIGLGFSRLLRFFEQWQGVQRWFLAGTGVLCLLFAAGAVWDMVRAWRHGPGGMRFGTPKRISEYVRGLIRRNVGAGLLAAGAFGIGFLISGLELVCTGQIYLPVLMFVNSTSSGWRTVIMLLAYNLAFVAPLLAVLFAGVYGVKSAALAAWGERHAILMRGLAGAVTLFLGTFLLILAVKG